MISLRSFAARLSIVLALLLLSYGALVGLLARHVAGEYEQEALQRLSYGLAEHIVSHWPEINASDPAHADKAERDALLSMLMVVNPGIQVYVLDAQGLVQAYIGDPAKVSQHQVDLRPVRAFLAGAPLPLLGTDPMGTGDGRIFSAAMFPPKRQGHRPPGYLYIVLDGRAREQVAWSLSLHRAWQGGLVAAGVGLLLTLAIGVFTFRRLTLPLHRLAERLHGFQGQASDPGQRQHGRRGPLANEVDAIDTAFRDMTHRLAAQARREHQQTKAHREVVASLAHDLRTPLTALHGQLEAMLHQSRTPDARAWDRQAQLLTAALGQSDKVRRLSQQLFELAALQSTEEVSNRERFNLDELVSDTVQKFELPNAPTPVTLDGAPPGRLEVDGDLHLIERALTNLIDNALRHARNAPHAVRVSMQRHGASARILIQDGGPGLPAELIERLERNQPVREPPIRRHSGDIGGLGLAIAQRVATLHGGSLKPLKQGDGACLCLALPLAS